MAVWAGGYIEKRLRVDDAVGAVAVHGVCGFYGVFLVGIFAGGFPTGVNNVPSSFGGQLMGMLAFFPLAFLPGFFASWILKRQTYSASRRRSNSKASTWRSTSRTSFPSSSGCPRRSFCRTGRRSRRPRC